jgi:hypothetical protein
LLLLHLHIWTSTLYALGPTSFFFCTLKEFKLFLQNRRCLSSCSRFLPSLFLLPVVSTTCLCLIFLLHYSFLLSHNFAPKSKKKGKKFLNVFHYIVNYERQLCTLVVH